MSYEILPAITVTENGQRVDQPLSINGPGLYLIAGTPNTGKTYVALCSLVNFLFTRPRPEEKETVVFVNMELGYLDTLISLINISNRDTTVDNERGLNQSPQEHLGNLTNCDFVFIDCDGDSVVEQLKVLDRVVWIGIDDIMRYPIKGANVVESITTIEEQWPVPIVLCLHLKRPTNLDRYQLMPVKPIAIHPSFLDIATRTFITERIGSGRNGSYDEQ